MGADLILYYLPDADTRKTGRREAFVRLIDTLAEEVTEKLPGYLVGNDIQQQRDELIQAFDRFEELKTLRDVARIQPYEDRPPLLVSGGLSWGDYPSESSETLDKLLRIPGCHTLFEHWAVEDQANDQAND
jgi:hypothetical protein